MACPYASNGDSGTTEMEYGDYLGLHKVLASQVLKSEEHGQTAHDEHLFIIVHQAFELWFKQCLFEIGSVIQLMDKHLDEKNTLVVIRRISRVHLILKLTLEQFPILETMTPHDFLDFRDFLAPASGFQSVQFRMLENRLGLDEGNRVKYMQKSYRETFYKQQSLNAIDDTADAPSLLQVIIKWLERTPGNTAGSETMWTQYEAAVKRYLDEKYKRPYEEENDAAKKEKKRERYEKQKETFSVLFDEAKYNVGMKRGSRRFSYGAFKGALMINIYRDEPRFHLPFQLLTLLMDIDTQLMTWRHSHAMMVQRMIGTKIGTGAMLEDQASHSGYQYLRATISDKYKVFVDLLNMSTFLLPSEYVPDLSTNMAERLAFKETSTAAMSAVKQPEA